MIALARKECSERSDPDDECNEEYPVIARSKREVAEDISEFWVSPAGTNIPQCLQQPQRDNPCLTIQYVLQMKCFNNVILYVSFISDSDYESLEPCDEEIVENSGSERRGCSLMLQGDHTQKTSISCERANKIQNVSMTSNMLFLSSMHENTRFIIESTNFEGNGWVKSLEARHLNIHNMILILPNQTILENVHLYNSSMIHKSQDISDCNLSCKTCQFEIDPFFNQSVSSIHIENCDSAIINFEAVMFVSSNFKLSFLTSVRAELNDIILSGNHNTTNSGSNLVFEQVDVPKETTVDILVNRLFCNENHISQEERVPSILTIISYATDSGNIAVSIKDSISKNSSKFIDLNILGYGETTQPSYKYPELNLRNVSLLSCTGLSNIVKIHSTGHGVVNIIDSNFHTNMVGISLEKRVDLDYARNPVPKTGVISINMTVVDVTVLSSNFIGNQGRMGGALSIKSTMDTTLSKIIINDSTFINNTAVKTEFREEGQGGAVWIQALELRLDITDSQFEDNMGHDSGGAVFVGSVTRVVSWWPDYKVPSGSQVGISPIPEPIIASGESPDRTTQLKEEYSSDTISGSGEIKYMYSGDGMIPSQVYCLKGFKGDKGSIGQVGHTGSTGGTGGTGRPGDAGYAGFQGATGYTGPIGPPIETQNRKRRAVLETYDGKSYADFSSTYDVTQNLDRDILAYKSQDAKHNLNERRQKRNSDHADHTETIEFSKCPWENTDYQCVRGLKGEKGSKGNTGQTGVRGAKGFTGYPGVIGPPGRDGIRGPPGVSSERKKRQAGPEPIQYETVYISSNSDCPKGERGEPGSPGAKGQKGMRGQPGQYGIQGGQGPSGPRGEPGTAKLDGNPTEPNYEKSPNEIIDNLIHTSGLNTFDISITHTIFKKNQVILQISFLDQNSWSERGGGGICFGNLYGLFDLHLFNVTFIENVSPMGGAVEISGYAKTIANMTQCVYQSNSAIPFTNIIRDDSMPKWGGGGILISQEILFLLIDNTKYVRNSAFSDGGAMLLYVSKVKYEVNIRTTDFIENVVTNANGGAISIRRPNNAYTLYGYNSHMKMFVTDSNFVSNNASKSGGGLYILIQYEDSEINAESVLHMTNVSFINNICSTYGAGMVITVTSHSLNIVLSRMHFQYNFAPEQAAGVYVKITTNEVIPPTDLHTWHRLHFIITDTNFIQNTLKSSKDLEKGGSVYLENDDNCFKVYFMLLSTNIVNSTGSRADGAGVYISVPLWHSTIILRDSLFTENYAGKTGRGGAISIFGSDVKCDDSYYQTCFQNCTLPMLVSIDNVTFSDNQASEGGSIYLKSDFVNVGNAIIVQNTVFSCCSEGVRRIAQNSSLLHSSFPGQLENVDFNHYEKGMMSVCPIADVVFDEQEYEIILNNVNFLCEESRSFIEFGPWNLDKNLSNPIQSLMSYCTECKFLPYEFGNGTEFITNETKPGLKKLRGHNHYNRKKEPCLPCPYGAVCMGTIKARPNYWGYEDEVGKMSFASCPQGYCCNNIEIMCEEHDTCALHREGRLCGRCQDGYTESLMSRTCVPNEECNDWWIFVGAIFVALTYLMWYTYKSELVPLIEWVILKISTFKTRRDPIVNVMEYKGSKVLSKTDLAMNAYDKPETQTSPTELKQSRIEKGYFDILVYFTNIITLLKVKVEFKSGSTGVGVLYSIEKYFTRYLDVDMQQVANVSVCPFPNMSAVEKSLARPGFVLLILTIWLSLYTFACMVEGVSIKRPNLLKIFRNFKMQLIEGYVETVKYSYSGLAGATFLLLTCVEIGGNLYWKYDANIECFSTWQHGIIAFAAVYTVPFSIATMVGIKLLLKGLIGYRQFMLACLFPLPFLLFWVVFYGMIKRATSNVSLTLGTFVKSSKHLSLNANLVKLSDDSQNIDEKSKRILETFQGPYRDEYSSWEGVIELRKLLFNTYYLIENNIYRLVCCTITAVIILLHHNFARPFNNKNSNIAESLSLGLLCIACITNGIKTVFTESGILVEPNTPTEQLLFLMNRLDRILFLILLMYIILSEAYFILKEFKTKRRNKSS